MRYKVTYTSGPKLDKYGHFKEVQPPIYTQEFDNYQQALEFASQTSTDHKKWSVNIYDKEGPEVDGDTTWLIGSYTRGTYYPNSNHVYNQLNYVR